MDYQCAWLMPVTTLFQCTSAGLALVSSLGVVDQRRLACKSFWHEFTLTLVAIQPLVRTVKSAEMAPFLGLDKQRQACKIKSTICAARVHVPKAALVSAVGQVQTHQDWPSTLGQGPTDVQYANSMLEHMQE
jgi:hypothetical protein